MLHEDGQCHERIADQICWHGLHKDHLCYDVGVHTMCFGLILTGEGISACSLPVCVLQMGHSLGKDLSDQWPLLSAKFLT